MGGQSLTRIGEFEAQLEAARPDTAELLRSAQLTVHPAVSWITLHGSRGLASGHRPDSDVDLCLVVDAARLANAPDPAAFLDQVLRTTLDAWAGPVEADLAAAWTSEAAASSAWSIPPLTRMLARRQDRIALASTRPRRGLAALCGMGWR